MLCKGCVNKPVIRGLKTIACGKCGKDCFVSYAYAANLCMTCSTELGLCMCCGCAITKTQDGCYCRGCAGTI